MTGGVVNIGYVELVGASLLMLVAGIVSWRMGLGQSRRILTLAELREAEVDMFCTVFIGNSAAKTVAGQLITPRGYRNV